LAKIRWCRLTPRPSTEPRGYGVPWPSCVIRSLRKQYTCDSEIALIPRHSLDKAPVWSSWLGRRKAVAIAVRSVSGRGRWSKLCDGLRSRYFREGKGHDVSCTKALTPRLGATLQNLPREGFPQDYSAAYTPFEFLDFKREDEPEPRSCGHGPRVDEQGGGNPPRASAVLAIPPAAPSPNHRVLSGQDHAALSTTDTGTSRGQDATASRWRIGVKVNILPLPSPPPPPPPPPPLPHPPPMRGLTT